MFFMRESLHSHIQSERKESQQFGLSDSAIELSKMCRNVAQTPILHNPQLLWREEKLKQVTTQNKRSRLLTVNLR